MKRYRRVTQIFLLMLLPVLGGADESGSICAPPPLDPEGRFADDNGRIISDEPSAQNTEEQMSIPQGSRTEEQRKNCGRPRDKPCTAMDREHGCIDLPVQIKGMCR